MRCLSADSRGLEFGSADRPPRALLPAVAAVGRDSSRTAMRLGRAARNGGAGSGPLAAEVWRLPKRADDCIYILGIDARSRVGCSEYTAALAPLEQDAHQQAAMSVVSRARIDTAIACSGWRSSWASRTSTGVGASPLGADLLATSFGRNLRAKPSGLFTLLLTGRCHGDLQSTDIGGRPVIRPPRAGGVSRGLRSLVRRHQRAEESKKLEVLRFSEAAVKLHRMERGAFPRRRIRRPIRPSPARDGRPDSRHPKRRDRELLARPGTRSALVNGVAARVLGESRCARCVPPPCPDAGRCNRGRREAGTPPRQAQSGSPLGRIETPLQPLRPALGAWSATVRRQRQGIARLP